MVGPPVSASAEDAARSVDPICALRAVAAAERARSTWQGKDSAKEATPAITLPPPRGTVLQKPTPWLAPTKRPLSTPDLGYACATGRRRCCAELRHCGLDSPRLPHFMNYTRLFRVTTNPKHAAGAIQAAGPRFRVSSATRRAVANNGAELTRSMREANTATAAGVRMRNGTTPRCQISTRGRTRDTRLRNQMSQRLIVRRISRAGLA